MPVRRGFMPTDSMRNSEPGTTLASLVAALFDRDGKLVTSWTATADELKGAPVVGAMLGRLVETAAEAKGLLDAYLVGTGATTTIKTIAPTSSLVTGYDSTLYPERTGFRAGILGSLLHRTEALDQLEIVVAQLGEHVAGSDELLIVVLDRLATGDVADRADRGVAGLAHAFGDRIGDAVDLRRLVVEQQVIVAEMRSRDVPVEVLGLEIEREAVRQRAVQRIRHALGVVAIEIGGRL